MNKNKKILVIVASVLCVSLIFNMATSSPLARAVKPEEPNLHALIQNIIDILSGAPIRHEVVMERLTDVTHRDYVYRITCDKPYELAAVYLEFRDPDISTPYCFHSLGVGYSDSSHNFHLGHVKYYEFGTPSLDFVTSAEVLSATGVSMRPIASANSAFDIICVLWEPDDWLHEVYPEGDEEFYVKIVLFAPSDANFQYWMFPEIPP